MFPHTIRGTVLWLFGWAFIIIGGVNYLATPIPEPTRSYLAPALERAPAAVYGWLFLTVGAFAIASAYRKFDRDRVGYSACALLSVGWALVYVCGWAFYDAPIRALGGSVLWFLFCAILVVCARIPRLPDLDSGEPST